MELTLRQTYDTLSRQGLLNRLVGDIPEYIESNLNPNFKLREYQKEAIQRLVYYLKEDKDRAMPSQLLFNMATGSGKTLLMAASILYLYREYGYYNFLFFVNSTNTIEKTRDNFLNPFSSKYLFNEKIILDNREVRIREAKNFSDTNKDDINIVFTTIQKLHSDMNMVKEEAVSREDFADKEIVIISDEAHHINAWTRNRLSEKEAQEKNTWEGTVMEIFNANYENIMLEYTATIDLSNPEIWKKYKDKLIYEYSLKEFRQDGYSKEVKVLDADVEKVDRMLFATVLSQYRRKIAEKNHIYLKPVILFKSKTIKESAENAELFHKTIKNLKEEDLDDIRCKPAGTVLEKAFSYFDEHGVSSDVLTVELKEDFGEEKCMVLDSENIDEGKQLKLNSLEDENNGIRAIFAVNMLNEDWDTLNLFDIVRLYETRDGKWTKDGKYIPGKTTLSEVQLIGRGARYFPFTVDEENNRFKRKFDNDPENEMKILEELYYHSSYVPKYIAELKAALRESGIMPPQEPKTVTLKVKEDFKKTEFWKSGLIFINSRKKNDGLKLEDISTIIQNKVYGPVVLKSGQLQEEALFENGKSERQQKTENIKLEDFSDAVIRKAIAKNDFYRFDNLKQYFSKLDSISSLIECIKGARVNATTNGYLTPDDKLKIVLVLLDQLKAQIESQYTEYEGTRLFMSRNISEVVRDKTLNIDINSDREAGRPMKDPAIAELQLDLSKEDWYVYDENYGTSEEKYFIRFLHGTMDKLKKKYKDVYLVRNANLFKLYNFSDGRATEPDFVLFLKKEDDKDWIQYQVFVEAKGRHLLEMDRWKEDFLMNIEKEGKAILETLAEDKHYKLKGMPFYNEANKKKFIDVFEKEFC
jgi:type III restriction enzyme